MSERAKATAKTSEAKTENSHSQTKGTNLSQSISSPIDQILFLQRTVGNRAVERLLKSGLIQTKLTIGQPGDIYEQEADHVADTVMRMPEPTISRQVLGQPVPSQMVVAQRQTDRVDEDEELIAPKSKACIPVAVREDDEEGEESVQRVCDECEEEMVNRAESEEDEETIPRYTEPLTRSRASKINHSTARNIGALDGNGSPLSEATKSFFEPRFGVDFSQVRIHTDSRAAETAESINARAFTAGRNIAFGSGQYAPHSHAGQKILAHELTHVLQQSALDRVDQRGPTPFLPRFPAIGTYPPTLQPGSVQRQPDKQDPKAKAAEAKRAKIEAAIQNLKTKYGIASVSEEKGETWTEAQLKTVDAAFSKMSSEEQAKLKGLTLIRTDKLSVERKGKKIEVVGMAGETWIRFTKKAFKTNMVTLHEVGHVIHKKVVREVEEKLRKSKVFTDMEAARERFADAASKNKRISGNAEQIDFANAMNRLTSAADDFMNSEETDRQTKEGVLLAAQADADMARMLIDPKDTVSKTLLDMHDRQRLLIATITQWVDERAQALGPKKKLTEFVAIVNKHNLARKSFKPFNNYVAKFWPDDPGEFFAESYAMWRSNPAYMKNNAKPLFDWFEKKGHLAP